MKTVILLIVLLQLGLCRYFSRVVSGYGPQITYTPIGWSEAEVLPDSEYTYSYNPVTRIYTYAPTYHFQEKTQPKIDFSRIQIGGRYDEYTTTRPINGRIYHTFKKNLAKRFQKRNQYHHQFY